MPTMGKYCKAYELEKFCQFTGFTVNAESARSEKILVNETAVERPRDLAHDSVLYLQEDYTVTDGIFKDQYVVFDQVTPEWKEFCEATLGFQIPNHENPADKPNKPTPGELAEEGGTELAE